MFIAALLKKTKTLKQPDIHQMMNEDRKCVHIHNGMLFSLKREILSFMTNMDDLDD
jgi:hypothetical protein